MDIGREVQAIQPFDPASGTVVFGPEEEQAGFWVGAMDVIREESTGSFYMYYRIRRPIDPNDPLQRGSRCRIARSEDGVRFEDVWELKAAELGSVSVEKGCFGISPSGRPRLYLSYECPEGEGWQIDLLEADQFDRFRPSEPETVLHPREVPGARHIKDPVVLRVGDQWLMYANYHPEAGGIGEATGMATSRDGREFTWKGTLLEPSPGWNAYTARVTDVVYSAPLWVMIYDGAGDPLHLYEEESALAAGLRPDSFSRLTDKGPWTREVPRRDVPHPDGPWQASPGSVRYVIMRNYRGKSYIYSEFTRESGAHDLRVNVLE